MAVNKYYTKYHNCGKFDSAIEIMYAEEENVWYFSVKVIYIEISFCPFCGEEL